MKKMILSLIAMLAIAAQASAMSYEQARREALFLTDKMAYELNLNDAQYEAAYEINLDYLMGVTSQADVFGYYWEQRNADIRYILYSWQWNAFCAATYFYRPLYWSAGYWHFGIYARYPHRDYYYFGRPHFYVSYRGGHSWRMNGGRSYYEHRHNLYRPHNDRNHHSGMRDGWDRGNYRNHSNGRTYNNHHNNNNHNNGGNGSGRGHGQNNHNNTGNGNIHNNTGHGSSHNSTPTGSVRDHNNRSASTVSSTRTTVNRGLGTSTNHNMGTPSNRSFSNNRSTTATHNNASVTRNNTGSSHSSAGMSRSSVGSNRSGAGMTRSYGGGSRSSASGHHSGSGGSRSAGRR